MIGAAATGFGRSEREALAKADEQDAIKRLLSWAILCRASENERDENRMVELVNAAAEAEDQLRDIAERIAYFRGVDLDGVQ